MTIDNKDYILNIQTVTSSVIRTLFEVIKEVMQDFNLIVTNESIKISNMNEQGTALVYMKMDEKNFASYYCENTKDSPLILGIMSHSILKIMKTIKNDDTISFSIHRSSPRVLIIRKENGARNTACIHYYDLCNIEYKEINIPSIEFDAEISLPSNTLQDTFKNYNSFDTDVIEIKSIGQQLILSTPSALGRHDSIIGPSEKTIFDRESSQVVQGKFKLKYLLLFSKASNLCNTVQVYLKNDKPLILSYNIGSLGEIKFIISPCV
ncbi:proliferating cell nuclear antigen [Gammaproteobacteria bacterium]